MQLPTDNEPLVLADGTKIDPSTGKVVKEPKNGFVSVPSPSEAQRIVAKTRKTVADLPMPPQQLSGVGLVAFYTLFGLNDQDICIAVNNQITLEQLTRIRENEAYIEFMQTAKANILHTEQETVRELFAKRAIDAANKIVELAESDNDVLAFTASKDVLDRAGHRPADVVEHRHKMEESTLNIVFIKKDETQNVPTIEAEATYVEETANG
jgi:hypothetical protein